MAEVIRTRRGILNCSTDQLGLGAFSVVFKGTYQANGSTKEVAVKRIDRARLQGNEFEREQTALESLDHENVLKLFDTQDDNQFRYFVLELCAATLGDYLGKKYTGPIPSVDECLGQMASGLAHIHSMKLAHRDIKPENVLISITLPVCLKISDFGLSKPITASGSYSLSAPRKGTLNYMAPEILEIDEGSEPLPRGNAASDVFALGCVFYVFLTKGTHPFGAGVRIPANISDAIFDLQKIEDQHLMHRLISKMIAHKYQERPAMSEVVDELAGVRAHQTC